MLMGTSACNTAFPTSSLNQLKTSIRGSVGLHVVFLAHLRLLKHLPRMIILTDFAGNWWVFIKPTRSQAIVTFICCPFSPCLHWPSTCKSWHWRLGISSLVAWRVVGSFYQIISNFLTILIQAPLRLWLFTIGFWYSDGVCDSCWYSRVGVNLFTEFDTIYRSKWSLAKCLFMFVRIHVEHPLSSGWTLLIVGSPYNATRCHYWYNTLVYRFLNWTKAYLLIQN